MTQSTIPTYRPVNPWMRVFPVILAAVLMLFAVATPSFATEGHHPERSHLLDIVLTNQPWNLLAFVAVPLALHATLAFSSLAILLFGRNTPTFVRHLERVAGLAVAPVFLALAAHLVRHEVLAHGVAWQGPTDLLSMPVYLLQVVPAVVVTLAETRLIGADRRGVRLWHSGGLVGMFACGALALFLGALSP